MTVQPRVVAELVGCLKANTNIPIDWRFGKSTQECTQFFGQSPWKEGFFPVVTEIWKHEGCYLGGGEELSFRYVKFEMSLSH